MRTLHVAALPFPSAQGTQALLHALLAALALQHETHLLCYGHGASELATAYTIHRSRAPHALRSLRSGPSLGKPWLDLALAARLRALERTLRPDVVVAHHVEAAACALLACRAPLLFVAHTSLADELPSYFSARYGAALRWLGGKVDAQLVRRATGSSAVSPLLSELLSARSRRTVSLLALPWSVPAPIDHAERAPARAELGLSAEHEVALYAGNLDGYQGLDTLLPALARLGSERPRLRWLIATAACTRPLRARLREQGLDAIVHFAPLSDEAARRRIHAAADLALVPRRAAGGLPIKLLDAWARGLPVVAARLALAGLMGPCAAVVERDEPTNWQRAIVETLDDLPFARERAHEARAYVAREHDRVRASTALHDQLRALLGPRRMNGAR